MLQNLVKNSEEFPLHLLLVRGKYFLFVNAFSETLRLKRSLVEGKQQQKKDRKKTKRERKKIIIKNEKPKVVGWFIVQKLYQN